MRLQDKFPVGVHVRGVWGEFDVEGIVVGHENDDDHSTDTPIVIVKFDKPIDEAGILRTRGGLYEEDIETVHAAEEGRRQFHPHGINGGLGRPDALDAVADNEGEDE